MRVCKQSACLCMLIACVHACVRACVRACMCACVCGACETCASAVRPPPGPRALTPAFVSTVAGLLRISRASVPCGGGAEWKQRREARVFRQARGGPIPSGPHPTPSPTPPAPLPSRRAPHPHPRAPAAGPARRHLHRKVAYDDGVALALAPRLEQVAAEAALQHGRRRQHDAGAVGVELAGALDDADVLEREGVAVLRKDRVLGVRGGLSVQGGGSRMPAAGRRAAAEGTGAPGAAGNAPAWGPSPPARRAPSPSPAPCIRPLRARHPSVPECDPSPSRAGAPPPTSHAARPPLTCWSPAPCTHPHITPPPRVQ
jgi:hypothetical protein